MSAALKLVSAVVQLVIVDIVVSHAFPSPQPISRVQITKRVKIPSQVLLAFKISNVPTAVQLQVVFKVSSVP